MNGAATPGGSKAEIAERTERGWASRLPSVLLRTEGAAALGVSLLVYRQHHLDWPLFIVLFLVPDLSRVGYIYGKSVGTTVYNLFHSYVLPALLAVVGVLWESSPLLSLALIWSAHVGLDRMLGFGLKYPGRGRDTHLGRV
jgi:hypothetical protein